VGQENLLEVRLAQIPSPIVMLLKGSNPARTGFIPSNFFLVLME